MKTISMNEIGFENKRFWTCFFLAEWRNAYDKQADKSAADMIEENCSELSDYYEWWREFTGYREDIFEISDGYSEEPTTLLAELDGKNILKIEFHPGDTVYSLNHTEIGCTGPHYVKSQPLPYDDVAKLLDIPRGKELFFLLLPMARLDSHIPGDTETARIKIEMLLQKLFAREICRDLAECILCALTERDY